MEERDKENQEAMRRTAAEMIASIHRLLDDVPTAWNFRFALAAMLEEVGEKERARVQKWIAERQFAPVVSLTGAWKWEKQSVRSIEARSYMIPVELYRSLPWASYRTRQEAEDSFGGALKKVYAFGW